MKMPKTIWALNGLAIAAILPWVAGCQWGNLDPRPIEQSKSDRSDDHREPPPKPTLDRRVFADTETVAADKDTSGPKGKTSRSGDQNRPPSDLNLSPNAQTVLNLVQSNATEAALLNEVTNSGASYDLSVEEILYLHDKGVPKSVIEAMRSAKTKIRSKGLTNQDWATSSSVTNLQSRLRNLAPSTNEAAQGRAPSSASYSESAESTKDKPVIIKDQRFYRYLVPYGRWHRTERYGACWKPSVTLIRSDWRPYHDRGRWLYTDYGWYWQSDYPWGWITFHYGRWYDHPKRGWLWKPGDTWAPAWVAWRSGAPYCGWAPLPPRTHYRPQQGLCYRGKPVGQHHSLPLSPRAYTFLKSDYLTHRHFHRHLASRHLRHSIYRLTRPHYRFEHRAVRIVANHGIDPEAVTPGRGDHPARVQIRDLPEAGEYVKPGHIERRDGQLVVYRGTIEHRPPPPKTPVKQKRTGPHVTTSKESPTDQPDEVTKTASQGQSPQRQEKETPSRRLERRLQRIVEEAPHRETRRGERRWTTRRTHYRNGSLSPAGERDKQAVVRDSDPEREADNNRSLRNASRDRSLRRESDPARRARHRHSQRDNDRTGSARSQTSPSRRSASTDSSRSSSSVRSSESSITSSSPTEAPKPSRESSPARKSRSSSTTSSSNETDNGDDNEPSEVSRSPIRGSDPDRRR